MTSPMAIYSAKNASISLVINSYVNHANQRISHKTPNLSKVNIINYSATINTPLHHHYTPHQPLASRGGVVKGTTTAQCYLATKLHRTLKIKISINPKIYHEKSDTIHHRENPLFSTIID